MLNKKSIVLSDVNEKSNKKAVLSLEEDGEGIIGKLRLYNFPHELGGVCSLGLYVDKKVHKAGLTLKANMLYDFYLNLKHIPSKFTVGVVNFQNAVASPILYGSSEGSGDEIYGSIISEIASNSSFKNTEQVLNRFGVDFDDEEKKIVEKEIDEALCAENCAECVYKKYFYENKTKTAQLEDETFATIKNEEKENNAEDEEKVDRNENTEKIFFDRLKPQIDKLFENNPAENNLGHIIPDSKWVKVEYENDGDFYVFGLLYDSDNEVRYVCYGVPAVFDEEPPKELAGYPIWLPLNDKKGFGYWLTYQDAVTGEPVKAILD